MNYIESQRAHDERILWQAWVARTAYLVPLAIFGISFYPAGLFKMAGTVLAVTDKRLVGRTGVWGRRNLDLPFARLEGVSVRQGMLGKLFDYGDIFVTAKDGSRTRFRGIASPLVFQREAEDATERALFGRTLEEYASGYAQSPPK